MAKSKFTLLVLSTLGFSAVLAGHLARAGNGDWISAADIHRATRTVPGFVSEIYGIGEKDTYQLTKIACIQKLRNESSPTHTVVAYRIVVAPFNSQGTFVGRCDAQIAVH